MNSPNIRLEHAGIERDRIERLRDQIAKTIRKATDRVDESFSDDDYIRLEQKYNR